jgi:hypothetical protein
MEHHYLSKYKNYKLRICIPTDRTKNSYADVRCPVMDCPTTLADAIKCDDDPSVPFH